MSVEIVGTYHIYPYLLGGPGDKKQFDPAVLQDNHVIFYESRNPLTEDKRFHYTRWEFQIDERVSVWAAVLSGMSLSQVSGFYNRIRDWHVGLAQGR